MDRVKVNIGNRTYNCYIAKTEKEKKLMIFLIGNKKNGIVRSINMRSVQTKGNGLLRGHKQTMIDDNDIRVICGL